MSLTLAQIIKSCELIKFTPAPFHIATHCCSPTIVADFDVSKQLLNNVEPMSTAFRKLQVLPLHLANFVTVIELPTLTSAFSNHMTICKPWGLFKYSLSTKFEAIVPMLISKDRYSLVE